MSDEQSRTGVENSPGENVPPPNVTRGKSNEAGGEDHPSRRLTMTTRRPKSTPGRPMTKAHRLTPPPYRSTPSPTQRSST